MLCVCVCVCVRARAMMCIGIHARTPAHADTVHSLISVNRTHLTTINCSEQTHVMYQDLTVYKSISHSADCNT